MSGTAFVAHIVKRDVAMYIALGLGIVAISLWVLLSAGIGRIGPVLVSLFAAVFFGLATLNLASLLMLRGPVIELNAEGIRWRRWSNDLIPWSAIIRAEIRPQTVASVLCLWLADASLYPAKTLLRWPFRFGRSRGYGDIGLYIQATDRSFDEMIAAVERFAPQLAAR